MAIHFTSPKPKELLASFNARIDQKEPKGKINTWERDSTGEYYTHTSTQWRHKAWLKPTVHAGKLTFNIYPSKGDVVTLEAYGFYHGHLIETFLNHFNAMFSPGTATALPEAPDRMK